ncbi:alveolar macrophage chemotactic factor-like [Petromyzon marinus]|uniref:C-X-C motif chemokine 15-like n=1 Tax=Petromyzon marinus TaxID=7757 RepID=A0AAJ7SMJ0_PETMA|nr:C-X-C motif chemokine 15-like [Petromyzon marinus]
MKLAVSSLLVCLMLCMKYSQAAPNPRCLCITSSSNFIPVKMLRNIEVIPKSSRCNKVEVIATLKTNIDQKICLSPAAPWVKALVSKLLNRSQTSPHRK